MDQMVLLVLRVLKVREERQVLLVHQVLKVLRERRVLLVLLVQME